MKTVKKAVREEVYNDWKMGGKPYPIMSRRDEFQYCREKYPEIPKTFMLKNHTAKVGVQFTDLAWRTFDQQKHLKQFVGIIFQRHKRDHTEPLAVPLDFQYNNGTNSMVCLAPPEKDPYTIDYIDDQFWLTADGEVIEEVSFPLKPEYYGKKTSSGSLMEHIGLVPGTDLILVCPYRHCHFFTEGLQCRYCDMDYCTRLQLKMGRGFKTRVSAQDVYEVILEAHKEEGRFRHHFITGGSDPRLNYQEEFDFHVSLVEAVNRAGKELGIDRIPVYPIMSPVEKDRMKSLYDAGADCFGAYFEVWGKEKFEIICPGKSKHLGWDEFLKRTLDAVEVFGWGNVHGGFVSGTELMYGYNDIEDAVNETLNGYEFLLQHGIIPGGTNLTIQPGTDLYKEGQTEPPLEFYCMLDLGRQELFKKYKANPKFMCYKHQVYSPYTDMARLL